MKGIRTGNIILALALSALVMSAAEAADKPPPSATHVEFNNAATHNPATHQFAIDVSDGAALTEPSYHISYSIMGPAPPILDKLFLNNMKKSQSICGTVTKFRRSINGERSHVYLDGSSTATLFVGAPKVAIAVGEKYRFDYSIRTAGLLSTEKKLVRVDQVPRCESTAPALLANDRR